MRICGLPGCRQSMEGMRADARYCSPAHRAAAARLIREGEIPVVIGPELSFTVAADWPARSERFWEGVDAVERNARRSRVRT